MELISSQDKAGSNESNASLEKPSHRSTHCCDLGLTLPNLPTIPLLHSLGRAILPSLFIAIQSSVQLFSTSNRQWTDEANERLNFHI
jgi:hypothetical protein